MGWALRGRDLEIESVNALQGPRMYRMGIAPSTTDHTIRSGCVERGTDEAMKLTLSKQRSWFAAGAGLVATVALPAVAHPPDKAAAVQANLAAEGAAPADPDDAIVADIHSRFGTDVHLRKSRIAVGSENGIVTLSGSAPNSVARDRAVQFAKETPGVFRVDNFIRLDVSSPEAPVPP